MGAAETAAAATPSANGLADLTVRELRAMARDRDDPDFTGRAIARASKDELVAFLQAG